MLFRFQKRSLVRRKYTAQHNSLSPRWFAHLGSIKVWRDLSLNTGVGLEDQS